MMVDVRKKKVLNFDDKKSCKSLKVRNLKIVITLIFSLIIKWARPISDNPSVLPLSLQKINQSINFVKLIVQNKNLFQNFQSKSCHAL
jgi:hypothetical protein